MVQTLCITTWTSEVITCEPECSSVSSSVSRSNGVVPVPPSPSLSSASSSSLVISWPPHPDGGAPISSYELFYRREFGSWQRRSLPASSRTATVQGLRCGTSYTIYLVAANDFGESDRSEMVTAKTGGLPPSPPPASRLLLPNSTWVGLRLAAWDTRGCAISSFVVEYSGPEEPEQWHLVSNMVRPEDVGEVFLISDLEPGTAFTLRMTGHNSAGSTVATFPFTTSNSQGALPSSMVDSSSSPITSWPLLGLLLLLSTLGLLTLGLVSRKLLAKLLAPKLPPFPSPSLLPPPPPPAAMMEDEEEETEALFISSPFLTREGRTLPRPPYDCYQVSWSRT